jgi:TRAP-type transport system large permease protein
MLGIGLAVAWWWVVRSESLTMPPRATGREKMRALIGSLWALGLPFIIILGLKFGIFTPTEAGVVAAVYSLFVATIVYRELKLGDLYAVFLTAAKVTAVVMFLVAASLVSAWLITIADLPGEVTELLEPLMESPTLLMIAIMVLVVIVGTAMDMTPTILILTPVLIPVIKQAGIDPIYFGVLFVINNAIGLITPPVGTVLNVVAGVSRVSMDDLIRGVWSFMLAQLIILALLIAFPALVLEPLRWLR